MRDGPDRSHQIRASLALLAHGQTEEVEFLRECLPRLRRLALIGDPGAGTTQADTLGQLLEAQRSLPVTGLLWLEQELWIPAAAVLVATLAALIPAISAYRVDVAQLLNAR